VRALRVEDAATAIAGRTWSWAAAKEEAEVGARFGVGEPLAQWERMHPAWGMSETCSAVTYSEQFTRESTSDDDSFVEVGSPIPGISIR